MPDPRPPGSLPAWFCSLVVCTAWLGLAAWALVVVPRYKHEFEGLGVEVDAATIRAISLSDLVVNYWYLAAVPFVSYAVTRPLFYDAVRDPWQRIAWCLGGALVPVTIVMQGQYALESTWHRFLGG